MKHITLTERVGTRAYSKYLHLQICKNRKQALSAGRGKHMSATKELYNMHVGTSRYPKPSIVRMHCKERRRRQIQSYLLDPEHSYPSTAIGCT